MQLKARHVATLIRTRRKELKLTQIKLQQSLGYQKNCSQYLSNIERGVVPFPLSCVNKLSCSLGVSRELIIDLMVKDYREQITEVVVGNI